MGRPIVISLSYTTSEAPTTITTTQSQLASGSLTINGSLATGGAATLSPPGGIFITTSVSASATTYTVTGTSNQNQPLVDTITGGTTTTASSNYQNWSTVTNISYTGGTNSGTVSVGTRQGGSTAWIPMDIYAPNQLIAISVTTVGTINYTVQYTNEDPFDLTYNTSGIPQQAVNVPIAALVGASSSQTATLSQAANPEFIARALRLVVNSGSGTAKMTIVQQSNH